MRVAILTAVLVLAMCSSSFAGVPAYSSINIYNWSNPTNQSSRANIEITPLDENHLKIHQPATPMKVWGFQGCGNKDVTIRVVTVNGQNVTMNYYLDYTFVVPMIQQWWTLEVNKYYTEEEFKNCFQGIEIYDDNDNSVPKEP